MFKSLLYREIKNYLKQPQDILQPVLFFILVISLFPIASGSDNDSLLKMAPAALWIALLLASTLASGGLFNDDYSNGTLLQDLIHIKEIWLCVLSKIIAAWIAFIVPLLIVLPILTLILHIQFQSFVPIVLLFLPASLCLLMIGCIAATIVLAHSKNVFLQFLIATPFYIPVLILGTIATQNTIAGHSIVGETSILLALTLFTAVTIIPFTSVVLRAQSPL